MSNESRMFSRIEKAKGFGVFNGRDLESTYLGDIDTIKYRELVYAASHPIEESLSEQEKYEQIIKMKDAARQSFQDTLDFKHTYLNFRQSLELVEKCQIDNPENPSSFFIKAIMNKLKEANSSFSFKFFSAVGTHLDILHKIDGFFKLYDIETGKELSMATIDITSRPSKDSSKADILFNINNDSQNKLDPSPNNKDFDKEFFNEIIDKFTEKVAATLGKNYKEK